MKSHGETNAVTLDWLLSQGDVAGDPRRFSNVRAAAIHAKLAAGESVAGGQLDIESLMTARMEIDLGHDRSLLAELLSTWQMIRVVQQPAVLGALLEQGLSPDAAPQGVPILHIIAACDVSESVQMLVNAGASLDLVCASAAPFDSSSTRNINANGLTAIEVARAYGCKNSLHMLEIARARRAMLDIATAGRAGRE